METINHSKAQMEKAIEHLRSEYSKLRVGRASVAMVENVKIDAYGSAMTLKELAAITTPDAKSITIQPWDRSLFAEIEKGILAANLGLTPNNDGKMIRITLPPLTEDRRKDFVKEIKKMGEEAKVSIRNIRRQSMEKLKDQKTSGELTEDGLKKVQDDVQKFTDRFVTEVETLMESKSREVLSL